MKAKYYFRAMLQARFLSTLLLLLLNMTALVQAQSELDLWASKWQLPPGADWATLMRRAPAYMGPNALPIPQQFYPRVDSHWVIESTTDMHHAPGDYTQSIALRVRLPLAVGRVAMDLHYRPIEWYQTSPEVRDLRRARDTSGRGSSNGDVWITTIAQLIRAEHNRWGIDGSMQVAVKTTAGKNLENARFTNSPGYIFDWHLGKKIVRPGRFIQAMRFYGNAGLYVWQMENDAQNDAFLFGLATDFVHGPWQLSLGTAGYVGWTEDGDVPIALRTELRYSPAASSFFFIGYQHHLQHLTTHFWRVGGAIRIPHKHQ